MKPFDLEKALAGEPVVTRDGRLVKIAGYNPNGEAGRCVIGWLENIPKVWRSDGTSSIFEGDQLDSDLFMAEKPKVKKEGWVNVCRSKNHASGYCVNGSVFNSEFDAALHDTFRIACVKIEWEEEAE